MVWCLNGIIPFIDYTMAILQPVNYLLRCILFCFLITGCVKDSVSSATSTLELSQDSLVFDWKGGERRVFVNSSEECYLVPDLPEWLDARLESTQLYVCATENQLGKVRSHDIIITSMGKTRTINVSQKTKSVLNFVGDKHLVLPPEASVLNVEIKTNIRYSLTVLDGGDEWIKRKSGSIGLNDFDISSDYKTIQLEVMANTLGSSREARVVIVHQLSNISDTLFIKQEAGGGAYVDGDVVTIWSSEKAGAELVFMGDGFTNKDLTVGGKYETSIHDAISHFFSIEPYKTYSDYFNVYMVVAESETEGVGQKNALGGRYKNKFGSAFGTGTEIICNDKTVFEYARRPDTVDETEVVTAVVVLNSDKYAGTAYLYEDGNSIALCPMSENEYPYDFRGIVQHEAGGHAFGLLADEYVYYDTFIPQTTINEIVSMHDYGFYLNLDCTDDKDEVLWSKFIGYPGYSDVGFYEGGYEYQFGVWRCEENSCMNDNVPYYNVQSRWAIYSRIMSLSGHRISFDAFVSSDKQTRESAAKQYCFSPLEEFIHLPSPVFIRCNE